MTALAFDVAMAALGANGPEDEDLDWDTIMWPVHEDRVRRLRRRIFKASKAGDLAMVRNLQNLRRPRGLPEPWCLEIGHARF